MFDDKLSKDLLLSARDNNNLAIIRILQGTTSAINSNLQDETGKTALHWAVINHFHLRDESLSIATRSRESS